MQAPLSYTRCQFAGAKGEPLQEKYHHDARFAHCSRPEGPVPPAPFWKKKGEQNNPDEGQGKPVVPQKGFHSG